MQRTRLSGLMLTLAFVAWIPITDAAESRPITLEECFQLALQHNLDVQITRVNPRLARLALSSAYSAYDPNFRSAYRHDYSTTPGGVDAQARSYVGSQTESDNFDVGISGTLPTGTTYSFGGRLGDTYGSKGGFIGDPTTAFLSRSDFYDMQTNFLGSVFSQQFADFLPIANGFENANGTIAMSLSQPLLKNFWIDGSRYTIAIRKKDVRTSELSLEYQIMQTVTTVEVAYYNLIAAFEQVKVMEKALQEAEQQLRENKKRVEVGVMAPLDEKEAESQVAASKANLLQARSSLTISQNTLRALITDEYSKWADVELEPSEKLSAVPQTFSRQDSWAKAMTLRPDLQQIRVDLEKRDIRLKYDYNQLFPQLDLSGSYGFSGSGDEMSGALDQIRQGSNPNWSIGTVLSIPLSNRQARYNYRTSKTEREQALLTLKRAEQNIMVDIDNAIAQARSSLEQVSARRQSSEYQEAAYEAEQKKLENGKSTSFQVLYAQRLLTARRAEEISALADYNRSLADLSLKEGSTLERHKIQIETR